MPTSVIDGTVEEADIKFDRRGVKYFRTVRFKLDDGTEHTAEKMVTATAVGDELVPGARGRFYLFKAFDVKGVHGVRTADGRAVQAFPGNNQKIFLLSAVLGVALNIVVILTRDSISLLGVGVFILGVLGWHFTAKGKREAQVQFDGDAGYRYGA